MDVLSRRQLFGLGGAAAGSAIFAGVSGRGLFAQQTDTGSDPVLRQVNSELAKIWSTAKQDGLRAEHARGAAALGRIWVAHASAIGVNEAFREAAERYIDDNGREAILNHDPDLDHLRHEASTRYKIDPSDDLRRIPPPSRDDRERLLNHILTGGKMTDYLAKAFDLLDRSQPRLIGIADNRAHVVRVQIGDPAFCDSTWNSLQAIMVSMDYACTWLIYLMPEVCMGLMMACGFFSIMYYSYCT